MSDEQGHQGARLAALNAIAQLAEACGGDLERIVRIVRVEGSVHCAPGFRGHPQVLNVSDLLVEVFGARGRHARSAPGIAEMPLDTCVQLSVWAKLRG